MSNYQQNPITPEELNYLLNSQQLENVASELNKLFDIQTTENRLALISRADPSNIHVIQNVRNSIITFSIPGKVYNACEVDFSQSNWVENIRNKFGIGNVPQTNEDCVWEESYGVSARESLPYAGRRSSLYANILDRTNEIKDAIDIIDNQIIKIIHPQGILSSASNSLLPLESSKELQVEKIAHLRLAKKFLNNILSQLSVFEESPLELRVNQLKAVSKLITHLSDTRVEQILGYFRQPTGAGKTVLFGIIAQLLNVKTLVLVPRTNLVEQTKKEFTDVVGIKTENIGLVMQGVNDTNRQFTIATYQSHVAKMKNDKEYKEMVADCELIICDEAHRAIGDQTFSSIKDAAAGNIEESSGNDSSDNTIAEELAVEEVSRTIGTISKTAAIFAFTATPELAGKSVDVYFKDCIASERYSDMVAADICVPFLLHRVDGTVTEVDLEGTFTEELEAQLLKRENTYSKLASAYASTLRAYRKSQNNSQYPLRGVAFCVNINECDVFANEATEQGLRCKVITGREAKGNEGQTIITEAEKALVDGELDLIITVKKLAEGWDCKPVNAAIWARACTSAADVVQGIGRTGRAFFDEVFGKKTVSHIFETRWELKTRNGRSREKRPLGIADALLRNGEDPNLICSNSNNTKLEVEKPMILPIVQAIYNQCLEKEDFAKTFSSVMSYAMITLDLNRRETVLGKIKESSPWTNNSSFEDTLLKIKYNPSIKELQKIKQQLVDLLGQEILRRNKNEELTIVVTCCNSTLAEKAFEQLISQNPGHEILRNLACWSNEYSKICWNLLLRQLPPAKHLVFVMQHKPELCPRAWNELIKRNMIDKELLKVILKDRNLRKKNPQIYLEAQQHLLYRSTDNNDLEEIIRTTTSPELGLEASKILLEQSPSSSQLYEILLRQPSLREKVNELLLGEGLNSKLAMIIKTEEMPWKLRAARLLYAQKPSIDELLVILQNIPEMENQAGEWLLSRKLSSEILVEIIHSSSQFRERAALLLAKRDKFSTQVRPKMEDAIVKFPELAPVIARALLDHKTQKSKRSLRVIITHVESLREEAAKLLMQHNFDSVDRKLLLQYTPEVLK